MEEMKTFVINEGVRLHIIKSENKGNEICVFYRIKAEKEKAATMAVLAKCLRYSSKNYRNISKLEWCSEKCGITDWDVYTVIKGNEHILCISVLFNDKREVKNVCRFIKEVIFNPYVNKYRFLNISTAKFAVESNIMEYCDDFRIYGKLRFAEEMARNRDFGIRENGLLDEVEVVSGIDVYKLYSEIIHSAPCEIYYCGDAQKECVRENIAEVFKFSRSFVKDAPEETLLLATDKKAVKEKRKIKESMFYAGFSPKKDLGKENIFPLMIVNEIFGGSPGILYEKIREEANLCYFVSSSIFKFKHVMFAEAAISKENLKPTVDKMKEIFESMKNKDVIKKYSENARKNLVTSIISISENNDRYIDFCLNNIMLGLDYTPEKFAEKIENTKDEEVLSCVENLAFDTIFFLEGEA